MSEASIVGAPPSRRSPRLYIPTVLHWKSSGRKLEQFALEGDCLRPWILEGDVVIVDRGLRPRDGDLVLVDMQYEAEGDSPWGHGVPWIRRHHSVKVWRAGELVCADGSVPCEPYHEVIGTVCSVLRRARWDLFRYPIKRMRFDVPADQPAA